MKAYITISEQNYQKIINDGEFIINHIGDEFYDTHGMKWLAKKLKNILNKDVISVERTDIESDDWEEYLMADQQWVNLVLDIPDSECLNLPVDAEHVLLSDSFTSIDEIEYEKIYEMLGDKNANDSDFKIREQNWERFFDVNYSPDTDWAGENIYVPYIYKISKEWIISFEKRQGKYWDKWIGPNKIPAREILPLEGYGDTLSVGDKFYMTQNQEIYELLGWEDDEDLIHVYCKTEDGGYSSFAAFGDRNFTKVNNIKNNFS